MNKNISVQMIEKINKLAKETRMFIIEKNREPSFEELSEIMGLSISEILEIQKAMEEFYEIDNDKSNVNNKLKNFILSLENHSSEEHKWLKCAIKENEKVLNEREKNILECRFGLYNCENKTYDELSRELGISNKRIMQIEAKALRKLKNPDKLNKIEDYID